MSQALLDRLVEHARHDAPDECCGLVGVRDGAATSVHPCGNSAHSPLRFEVEPLDLLRATEAIEDAGDEVGAIYHSHPKTEPAPSQTDVNWSEAWPGIEWVIVGLRPEPTVRSFLIEDGRVREVPIEVT